MSIGRHIDSTKTTHRASGSNTSTGMAKRTIIGQHYSAIVLCRDKMFGVRYLIWHFYSHSLNKQWQFDLSKSMNILFIHQNFPGQFKHLAPALVQRGHRVMAMTMQKIGSRDWKGVFVTSYGSRRSSSPGIHPWITDLETKVIRGEACFHAALKLKENGFTPDIIVSHYGWGESLFLKKVWPQAKLGIYCEFFYQATGADLGFDPEFSTNDVSEPCRIQLKNINSLLHFDIADAGLSPTLWQAGTFPLPFRDRISVIHDGIDTDTVIPNEFVSLSLSTGLTLTRSDEVITFVSRNLEPYRGYHIFMRALPELLRQRPKAHVLIVGGDGVSYGAKPAGDKTWKTVFAEEVRSQISEADWSRVHFLGNLPYQHFISVLQLSTVHLYLTYPFVLSWSLLEAMSAGCAIVASDTAPVREVLRHDDNGVLVDFFDTKAIVSQVCELAEAPLKRKKLSSNARNFARQRYDLHMQCLPKQISWVEGL